MVVYWALFLIPAVLAHFESETPNSESRASLYWLLFAVFMVIAFRETGGDWPNYSAMFARMQDLTFFESVSFTDPAYGALTWLSTQLGWGIYGVNAVCAAIFLFGFARFAANEERPILMLALAIPYLIIVVAVGYTRQGTAIGFELLALVALGRGKLFKALLWIFAATMFHSSAAVLLPLSIFAISSKNDSSKNLLFALGGVITCILAYYQLGSQLDTFVQSYVVSDRYSSQGAVIRSGMSASAAIVFLWERKRWAARWGDSGIWFAFSLAALALLPMTFYASTAADRLGLFVIPLQIIVFGRLPCLAQRYERKTLLVGAELVAYAAALWVWLYVGQFAQELWLPFRSLLIGEIG